MKRHSFLLANEPWCRYSDGRPFTRDEIKKLRAIYKRTHVKGEHARAWFYRIRAVIEQHESAKVATVIKRPGVIARARAWLNGTTARPTMMTRL